MFQKTVSQKLCILQQMNILKIVHSEKIFYKNISSLLEKFSLNRFSDLHFEDNNLLEKIKRVFKIRNIRKLCHKNFSR